MKYRKKNPMSVAERRQYEREMEAYQARKDLERHLEWERYQRREEEEAGGRRKAERRRNPSTPTWWVAKAKSEELLKKARRYQRTSPELSMKFSSAASAWVAGWAPGPSGWPPLGKPADIYGDEWTWTASRYRKAKDLTEAALAAEGGQKKKNPSGSRFPVGGVAYDKFHNWTVKVVKFSRETDPEDGTELGVYTVERAGNPPQGQYSQIKFGERYKVEPRRLQAISRKNPPPTYDTCPSYMDYDWWVEHYAPEHVRETARAKALAEAQRLYAPPPATAREKAQDRRDEAAYGRAMRRERDAQRNNPGLGALAVAAIPAITRALGSKLTAFNALPFAERKTRLRDYLKSNKRWGFSIGGGLAAAQIAKSDAALSAIIRGLEKHGHAAVESAGDHAAREISRAPRS